MTQPTREVRFTIKELYLLHQIVRDAQRLAGKRVYGYKQRSAAGVNIKHGMQDHAITRLSELTILEQTLAHNYNTLRRQFADNIITKSLTDGAQAG